MSSDSTRSFKLARRRRTERPSWSAEDIVRPSLARAAEPRVVLRPSCKTALRTAGGFAS
jgi:hypothetical protein